MRKFFIFILLISATTFAEEEEECRILTPEEVKTLSLSFGHFIGKTVVTPNVHFDLESLIKGMRDEVAGLPSPLTDEETQEQMMCLQKQAIQELGKENLKTAEEFLQKNRSEEGVREIVPGQLQAMVLEEGEGDTVTDEDTPTVHFTGKYINGDVFTSTDQIGKAIPLNLNNTIKGFKKGVVGMKEGERRRLFIHPDLAYGKTGQLPPNSLLIFDIEVVKVKAEEKDEEES